MAITLRRCGLSTESFLTIWLSQYKFLINEFLIKKSMYLVSIVNGRDLTIFDSEHFANFVTLRINELELQRLLPVEGRKLQNIF